MTDVNAVELSKPERGFSYVGDVPLIRSRVYRVLLESILEGVVQPGERIIERDVAAQIGVSTTPVKEALRRLEIEGFVTSTPRRGVVVSEMASAPLADVATVRLPVESLAARLAAARVHARDEPTEGIRPATDDEVLSLHRAVAAVGSPPTNTDGAARVNEAFHDTVRRMSGNVFLVQIGATLLEVDSVLRRRALSDPGEIHRAVKEHRLIGEAILSGDPDAAQHAMHAHITNSARRSGVITKRLSDFNS